jgi:hypothetical protein
VSVGDPDNNPVVRSAQISKLASSMRCTKPPSPNATHSAEWLSASYTPEAAFHAQESNMCNGVAGYLSASWPDGGGCGVLKETMPKILGRCRSDFACAYMHSVSKWWDLVCNSVCCDRGVSALLCQESFPFYSLSYQTYHTCTTRARTHTVHSSHLMCN